MCMVQISKKNIYTAKEVALAKKTQIEKEDQLWNHDKSFYSHQTPQHCMYDVVCR